MLDTTLFDLDAVRESGPDRVRKVNLVETPNGFVDVHVLAPGQAAKVHTHAREDKTYVVLSGRGRIRAGDEEHDVRAGHLVFCPAGLPHGVVNDREGDLRLLVVMAPHPRPEALGAS